MYREARKPLIVNPKRLSLRIIKETIHHVQYATYLLIGIPSVVGGGLTLSLNLSPTFVFSSNSSALVSRFKKLLSFTGLPLCTPPVLPRWILPLPLPPWLALPTPGDERCGMFSGRGCWEPTLPVSTELALPALERA
jgi:hypothetical protein